MLTNNISEIRREKNIFSQDDLAAASACAAKASLILNTIRLFRASICLRMAKYLDMTVEELFVIQDS